jgi:transposase
MPVGIHINPLIKAEIITKIKDEGMSVSEAASKYGVGNKAIYRWLRDGAVNTNTSLILENNRLYQYLHS